MAQKYFRDAVEAITSGKKESREDSFWNEEAGRVLEGYIHLLAESGNIDVINIPAVSRIILEGDEIKKKSTRGYTTWLQYYLEKFKSSEIPAVINVNEFSRRFGEMNAFYGLAGADADRDMTLVVNTANPVIQAFTGLDDEKKKFVANQVYYLAMLSYKKLSPDEMKAFSANSVKLLEDFLR